MLCYGGKSGSTVYASEIISLPTCYLIQLISHFHYIAMPLECALECRCRSIYIQLFFVLFYFVI